MTYALTVSTAINLIIGTALLMVWRSNRRQGFSLYIGLSYLMGAAVAGSYGMLVRPDLKLSPPGVLVLLFTSIAYTTLLVLGVVSLARRRLPARGTLLLMLLAVGALTGTAYHLGGPSAARICAATINLGVGVFATRWLWNADGSSFSTLRLVGPLLTLMGASQYLYVLPMDSGLLLQIHVSSVLRVALGVAMLYAAWKRAEADSLREHQRFRVLTERSHQGILIAVQGRVVYANPALRAIYGVPEDQALSAALFTRFLTPRQRADTMAQYQRVLDGQDYQLVYEGERVFDNGRTRWLRVEAFRTEWDGQPAVQALITDDTDRHSVTQAMLRQAMQDELTGLPNRAALLRALRERCAGGPASPPFVLMLLDIDRFKLFNEAHGHEMGDQVILALSRGLSAAMLAHGAGHVVMRPGEDEFALLSGAGSGEDAALDMAGVVRELLSNPLEVAHREFFVDVSMGIALFPQSAADADALLRAANAALHAAKRTPGTSHALARPEFERGASNLLEQEQALRAGILNAEFHLVYQPKVDAHNTELVSFEALARWERPGVGYVSPVEFIAAAERTGLIGELGSFFLWEACQQLASWRADHGFCVPVAVNVSPLQLLDADFPKLVARVLEDTGTPPELLTLEITESSAVQNLEQTIAQVSQLREMGVQVALDDFGAGFSSLNMLRSLPLRSVKVDRGLVDPLPAPEAVAVVRAICQLAEALHLTVVAEGVETEAQAQCARDAGCEELQGYLYAKPLSRMDAGRWLMATARQRGLPLAPAASRMVA